jgi:hypothetical protein
MLEYVQLNKLFDKLVLTLICFVVFGFLYTTVDKSDVPFDNANLGNSMLFSLGTQLFRFDIFSVYNRAFALVIIQVVLTYVILVL